MQSNQQIRERLNHAVDPTWAVGPRSESEVQELETELGLRFPPSFRMFLLDFGAGGLSAPYSIYGITGSRATDSEPPMHTHLLDAIRRDQNDPDCHKLVPIAHDGCSTGVYLDLKSTDDDGESPVIARGPGVNNVRIAESFLHFAEQCKRDDPLANLPNA